MAGNVKNTEKSAFLYLLLGLLALGCYVLYPFLTVLVMSVILVVMLYPLHKKFLKWTKGREQISAFLSVLASMVLIIFPVLALVGLVTTQIATVVGNLSMNVSKPQLTDFLTQWQEKISFYLAKFEYQLDIKMDLVPVFQKFLGQFAGLIARYSPQVLAETANLFLNFFILIIVMFFLFRDGEAFFKALIRISPVKDQYELRLAKEIKDTVYGVFYGSFLTGIVQAILAGIGFYFAGVEGALVWATITFFVSFIPIIGTAGVIVPLVLALMLTGRFGHGLFLAIYGAVVIGLADNILKPVLIRSNMHQLVLFLSIFGGIAVFGAAGLLIGPIVMALLTATIKIYEKDFTNHAG